MTDSEIARLASVVYSGELASCGALLDRLGETGDVRYHELNRLLGRLLPQARGLDDHTKAVARVEGAIGGHMPNRGRRRTPEEEAYRLDEACYRLWRNFSDGLRELFWAELGGLPPLEALAAVEVALQAPKQAKRLEGERNGDDMGYGKDGPGEMMTSAPLGGY